MGGKLSKYQKFEVEVISRGEIHGADYNPRVISEDARKRLKRMLAKHGLVQPLVWNRRTGNLVSGHQRLSQLDQLERSQDYDLQVSVVDVDEREEKILNVQLNNPSMQGDWDMDKLNGLAGENGIDPEEFGFPPATSPSCSTATWAGPSPILKKWPKPRIPCAKSRSTGRNRQRI